MAINDSGTEVTVTGSAEKYVDRVVVLIGPRQSGGQYWARQRECIQPASYFTFQQSTPTPTPTPTPPGGSIVSCAEQYGDSCFNGPGWGPPSVYQPGH